MGKVVTFGCRLNIYESEVIKKIIENEKELVVFNTCGVTKEAERKAKQAIRKYKRENPKSKIIITGCAAQLNPDDYIKLPEVDQVLGNAEKMNPENYKSDEKVLVSNIMKLKELSPHLISGFDGKVRAFIQIQNGCNHRCAFCTIPYARGRSRSMPFHKIKEQITKLLENGYKEFVLTGVDITDYGSNLEGRPKFGMLIKNLLKEIPELKRLRISSIDPSEIDNDLWDVIEHEERVLPHLHVSLQAGDDFVLKKMKRRHIREDVFKFLERIKKARPLITLGADVIAGFPEESDQMFENTLDMVKNFDLLHSFPFSLHKNTAAYKMTQVPKEIIKNRAKILSNEGKKCYARLLKRWERKKDNMLVESVKGGIIKGKTDHYIQREIVGNAKEGDIITIN